MKATTSSWREPRDDIIEAHCYYTPHAVPHRELGATETLCAMQQQDDWLDI